MPLLQRIIQQFPCQSTRLTCMHVGDACLSDYSGFVQGQQVNYVCVPYWLYVATWMGSLSDVNQLFMVVVP